MKIKYSTDTIIMFIIMLLRRSLFLTGVQHQQLLKNARPTRKWPRRCANRLVGPYSHVWTVCRLINTHLISPLEQLPNEYRLI